MALASVAPRTERRLANQGVASLNPNQGTCLGPQWGVHERQPHADVSLPLISLYENKILKNPTQLLNIYIYTHTHTYGYELE